MTNSIRGGVLRAAAALLMALPASAASDAAASEAERNRETVSGAFEAWASGGSVFDGLLAEDVVWTIHGSGPVAGTYNGRRAFVEQASAPLVSRLATPIVPHVHRIWAEGDTVVVRFDGSATTTSGAPYRNQFVWIFEMEDGTVARAEAFLDLDAYDEVVENNTPATRGQGLGD